MSTGQNSWVLKLLLGTSLLALIPSQAHALPGVAFPGVSRALTATERARVESVIQDEIVPLDPVSGRELLDRLHSGRIKAWLRGGFGFTSPINGTLAIAEAFFTPEGAYQAIRARVELQDAKLRAEGVQLERLSPEEAARRRWSMAPLLPYLAPSARPSQRDTTSRMFLASMLVHENVHCLQGRRYLVLGDIAVLAASNISTLLHGPNPMELEAYSVQLNYAADVASAVEARTFSGRRQEARPVARHMIQIVSRSLNTYQ